MQLVRLWVAIGALMGAAAVAGAAYAAHAPIDPARTRALSSAVQMQGWHALALVACGLWAIYGGWPVHLAAALFLLGTLLFCGAVYIPLFGGPSLGMTAPVGGSMLIIAWLVLAFSALKSLPIQPPA